MRLRTIDGPRRCERCETVLSRYNRASKCFAHREDRAYCLSCGGSLLDRRDGAKFCSRPCAARASARRQNERRRKVA